VLYITERCVFQLGPDGLELIEVAPGIDIEKDIIGRMSFRPHIPDHPGSWTRASSPRAPCTCATTS
jgi:propionate CoA-transferase